MTAPGSSFYKSCSFSSCICLTRAENTASARGFDKGKRLASQNVRHNGPRNPHSGGQISRVSRSKSHVFFFTSHELRFVAIRRGKHCSFVNTVDNQRMRFTAPRASGWPLLPSLLLAALAAQNAQGKNGITFVYPDKKGLVFNFLDTINVTYECPFPQPLLYTFCQEGDDIRQGEYESVRESEHVRRRERKTAC